MISVGPERARRQPQRVAALLCGSGQGYHQFINIPIRDFSGGEQYEEGETRTVDAQHPYLGKARPCYDLKGWTTPLDDDCLSRDG